MTKKQLTEEQLREQDSAIEDRVRRERTKTFSDPDTSKMNKNCRIYAEETDTIIQEEKNKSRSSV